VIFLSSKKYDETREESEWRNCFFVKRFDQDIENDHSLFSGSLKFVSKRISKESSQNLFIFSGESCIDLFYLFSVTKQVAVIID
jgi:hypothetical protein